MRQTQAERVFSSSAPITSRVHLFNSLPSRWGKIHEFTEIPLLTLMGGGTRAKIRRLQEKETFSSDFELARSGPQLSGRTRGGGVGGALLHHRAPLSHTVTHVKSSFMCVCDITVKSFFHQFCVPVCVCVCVCVHVFAHAAIISFSCSHE